MMLKKICLIMSLGFFTQIINATPKCSKSHCGAVSTMMNKFCKENGMTGKPYMVLGPNHTVCLCHCSCFTSDTQLRLASGEEISFSELPKKSHLEGPLSSKALSVSQKLMSHVVDTDVVSLTMSNNNKIKVSKNHTFITAEMKTITATGLKKGSLILDADLNTVSVSESKIVPYSGKLSNVIVLENSNEATDHVIVTNGLLSGDFILQAASDSIQTGVDIRSGIIYL